MSRVPLRMRLTAAFALAMVLVLTGAALCVFLRLKADLDESVTAALDARAAAVLAAGSAAAAPPGDPEEGFALLVSPDRPRAADRILGVGELRRAAAGRSVLVERTIPGVEGRARVLARLDPLGLLNDSEKR